MSSSSVTGKNAPDRGSRRKSVDRAKASVVTVAELRSNFKDVEAKLAKGLRVQVTRRGEVVAEMVAPPVRLIEAADSRGKFVEFLREREAWLRRTWGDRPVDIDTTALISEGRERDLLS